MVYGYYWFTIFILFGEMIHYSLWVLLIRTKLSLMIHSEPKHSCHLKPEHFSGLTLYFLLQRWNCEKKKKKVPIHRPKPALLFSAPNSRYAAAAAAKIHVKTYFNTGLSYLRIKDIV